MGGPIKEERGLKKSALGTRKIFKGVKVFTIMRALPHFDKRGVVEIDQRANYHGGFPGKPGR